MNEYIKQANEFLDKTQTTFDAEYLRNGVYFESDKDKRDIYKITLSKEGRIFSFEFGQSINCSGKWLIDFSANGFTRGQQLTDEERKKARSRFIGGGWGRFCSRNKNFEIPTAYCVLSALTKYDPGSFEDFCGNFGDDTDSRKAEKTYKAIQNEYTQLCTLYSDTELAMMGEIQ